MQIVGAFEAPHIWRKYVPGRCVTPPPSPPPPPPNPPLTESTLSSVRVKKKLPRSTKLTTGILICEFTQIFISLQALKNRLHHHSRACNSRARLRFWGNFLPHWQRSRMLCEPTPDRVVPGRSQSINRIYSNKRQASNKGLPLPLPRKIKFKKS